MWKLQQHNALRTVAIALIVMLAVTGCGTGMKESPIAGGTGESGRTGPGAVGAPPFADADMGGRAATIEPIAPERPGAPRSQAIIQNARVTLEIGMRLDETLVSLQELADRYGGYIEESRHSGQEPGYREGYAVLRVPSRQFTAVLRDLEQLGTVTNRHTYTEDVGDQLVDLEVRQQSAEQREQRLRELISQATEISDLIALENELARVRTEIEMMAAQRKRLEDLVAFSTITVQLYEVAPGQEPTGPVSLWERVALAFERGMSNAGDFASGLLVFVVATLPVLVVIAAIVAPIWWGMAALRRATRRRRAARGEVDGKAPGAPGTVPPPPPAKAPAGESANGTHAAGKPDAGTPAAGKPPRATSPKSDNPDKT